MFTSWQTSLLGVVVLVVGTFLFFMGKITWDQYILFLGAGGIGLAAKDGQVTGGTRPQ